MQKYILLVVLSLSGSGAMAMSCNEALGPSSWQMSTQVENKLRKAGYEDLVGLPADHLTTIEVQFERVRSRENAKFRKERQEDQHLKWWTDWLKREFTPEQVDSYIETVYFLEVLYGPDVRDLLSQGVEIHQPKTGSVLYGYFVLNGKLQAISEFLGRSPAHLPANKNPRPPIEMGANPPEGWED